MSFAVPDHERWHLRELAKKQAEYAALPVMEMRKRQWHDLNDGKPNARPPVVIETWTFDRDFMLPVPFHCTSEAGRAIEWQLTRNIRNHELIDDDKVIPNTFDFGWFVDIEEFGPHIRVSAEHAPDAQGQKLGFQYHYPITNLAEGLEKLELPTCSVDRKKTMEWQQFLEDLLGDILPVRLRTGTFGHGMLTHRVVALMGMEAFFLAMYEEPENVHRLMAYLRDSQLHIMRWAEREGLLRCNNQNQDSFGSSYNFTRKLPKSKLDENAPAKLGDMWGCSNSQETVGISREMFHEFCFPYYRDVCEPFGLLYYGCCEPTHTFWDDIRALPHLKKISMNRWCDQHFLADAVRGTDLILSRKPDPNLLGVVEVLDEEAWVAHIRETLDATKGASLEFIIRDVYTVHGNIGKAKRAVALARQEIDRRWGG
jgi:hypothetical protein